jgi:hypothetical protein
MTDSHERCGLLVAGLHELRLSGTPQGSDHAVDAVAQVAEHPVDAPLAER